MPTEARKTVSDDPVIVSSPSSFSVTGTALQMNMPVLPITNIVRFSIRDPSGPASGAPDRETHHCRHGQPLQLS